MFHFSGSFTSGKLTIFLLPYRQTNYLTSEFIYLNKFVCKNAFTLEWNWHASCIMYLQRYKLLLISGIFLSIVQVLDILPLHIRATVEAQKCFWKENGLSDKNRLWSSLVVNSVTPMCVWVCILYVWPPLRKQCHIVCGQEKLHPISSSSDREDLVETAEPHSLLFCGGATAIVREQLETNSCYNPIETSADCFGLQALWLISGVCFS